MSEKRMKPPRDEDKYGEEETDDESEGEESANEGGAEIHERAMSSNINDDLEGGGGERKTAKGASDDEGGDEEGGGVIKIPDGNGIPLGKIPRIEENIENTDCEHLIPLHKVLFNRVEKDVISKRNIKNFKGFDFHQHSFQYFTKRGVLLGFKLRVLRNLCAFLDLKVAKEREDLVENILNFLMKPKAFGRSAKERGKGREWKTGKAYRDKNRESSVEQETTDDGDETEDEEDNDDEEVEGYAETRENEGCGQEDEGDDTDGEILERREQMRQGTGGGSKKCSSKTSNKKDKQRSNGSTVEEITREDERKQDISDKSEEENGEIDRDNNKKGKGRGRSNSKKLERKRKMSSEDGPPRKKSKKVPSNTDIKKFLKEFLEGADLDDTPMNIILQKLNEQYPGIDLSEKKEFIKENVIYFVRSIRKRGVVSNAEL